MDLFFNILKINQRRIKRKLTPFDRQVIYAMEYYAAIYHGDKKQKYLDQVHLGPHIHEIINGVDGFGFSIHNVPIVFIAYTCWAWDFYGETFTNLLFKINPYRSWSTRPTFNPPPNDSTKQQFDFYMQAFQKRMVNKDIKYKKHPLFKVLNTPPHPPDKQTTREEFSKLLTMMNEYIKLERDSPSAPTPPKPDEFDYNDYIVYTRQCEILNELD